MSHNKERPFLLCGKWSNGNILIVSESRRGTVAWRCGRVAWGDSQELALELDLGVLFPVDGSILLDCLSGVRNYLPKVGAYETHCSVVVGCVAVTMTKISPVGTTKGLHY